MTVGISAWIDDGDESIFSLNLFYLSYFIMIAVLIQSLYFIVGSYVVNCFIVLIFRNFLMFLLIFYQFSNVFFPIFFI